MHVQIDVSMVLIRKYFAGVVVVLGGVTSYRGLFTYLGNKMTMGLFTILGYLHDHANFLWSSIVSASVGDIGNLVTDWALLPISGLLGRGRSSSFHDNSPLLQDYKVKSTAKNII